MLLYVRLPGLLSEPTAIGDYKSFDVGTVLTL
jgi:hypothetical protein